MSALEDQWALVTGAGDGVGRAVALELARQGASIALVGRQRPKLDMVADECQAAGAGQAIVFIGDLSIPEQVEHAVDFVLGLSDGIDILVNGATTSVVGHAFEGEPDAWDRMARVNLLAPMRLARRVSPSMIARGGGTIIHFGHLNLLATDAAGAALNACSAGLRAWSRSCAEVLGEHGIKVSLVRLQYLPAANGPAVGLQLAVDPEEVGRAVLFAIASSAAGCPEEIVLRRAGGL